MRNMTVIAGASVLCVFFLAASSLASANPATDEVGPSLVSNGSFEDTSTLAGSGWAISGAFLLEGFDYFIDASPADAHGGDHSFGGGAIGALGYISQNITTVPGANYNIHLWLANLSGFTSGTAIEVRWGGNVVYSASDIPGFAYNEIVIDPIATSTTTTLAIGLRDDAFFLNVDDVSVRAVSAVPEPTTFPLLLGALAAAVIARRLRHQPRIRLHS